MTSKCDVCNEVVTNPEALRWHWSNRHFQYHLFSSDGKDYVVSMEGSKYHCPFDNCGKTYQWRDSLGKHLKDVHKVGLEGSVVPLLAMQVDRTLLEGKIHPLCGSWMAADVFINHLNCTEGACRD